MGTLTPGASYVYEKVDGVTYAREAGSNQRMAIGWDYTGPRVSKLLGVPVSDLVPFAILLKMAETNPDLKEELDRLVTYYHLCIDNKEESVMWHPV
jgi:hypothetical protein